MPDYDIVGVELSQGVQRDTASARPSPPDRDAPYDGVILAGTKGEWGHPESFSGEVPAGAHPRLGRRPRHPRQHRRRRRSCG